MLIKFADLLYRHGKGVGEVVSRRKVGKSEGVRKKVGEGREGNGVEEGIWNGKWEKVDGVEEG